MLHRAAGVALQRTCARLAGVRLSEAWSRAGWRALSSSGSHMQFTSSSSGLMGAGARWASSAATPLLAATLVGGSSGSSGSSRRRVRRQVVVPHAATASSSSSQGGGIRSSSSSSSSSGIDPARLGAARLHSLRLTPAPAQHRPQLPPRMLRALSPTWPEQPGDRQQQQQRRGLATQPLWWQFWARPSGDSDGGGGCSDGGGGGLNPATAGGLVPPAPLPADMPSAAHERELKAVNVAVVVNAIIFVAKMLTWGYTGSGALLAEGMHSLADVANQMLLKHGVIRSRRKPTREHQYGFHKEKYVYALISAACVFCVGCGASVLHGFSSLANPHALENMSYSLAVLLGSSVLEAYSLQVAFRMIKRSAEEQGMGVWQYIQRGRDPTTAAILWEDGGAVAGLGLAGTFTLLTWLTGQPHWDALGSIAVGLLMGVIALQLMRTNKRFLIGQAMEPQVERSIVQHLQDDSMVVRVIDPKSEEMGDGVYRFKAEIQWSGEHVVQKYLAGQGRDSLYRQIRTAACTHPPDSVEQATMEDAIDLAMMEFGKGVIRTVGSEIDRLEGELRELVPGLVYVDLETDKGGKDGSSSASGSTMGSMLGSADWPDGDIAAMRRLYEGGVGGAASEDGSKQPPAAAA